MRPLTLESATAELVGSRLFCARERAFYPIVRVTLVEPWSMRAKVPHMVFISFVPESMPDSGSLLELTEHPNTRLLVDAAGSPWHILEPGEDPPG